MAAISHEASSAPVKAVPPAVGPLLFDPETPPTVGPCVVVVPPEGEMDTDVDTDTDTDVDTDTDAEPLGETDSLGETGASHSDTQNTLCFTSAPLDQVVSIVSLTW